MVSGTVERYITHIYIPDFPIQMEVLRRPSLEGRPVVVVPHPGERSIIRAASQAAKNMGIQKGMLLSAASRLCRELEVLPFDERFYYAGSETVFSIACRMSPIAEPANLGKAYADLTFAGKSANRLTDICWRAIKDIRVIGISPTLGLAGNKLVSLIASRVSQMNDLGHIPIGGEKTFLHPLSAGYLPVVDAKTWRQLMLMGLKMIGNIAGFEASDLAVIFGKAGVKLHEQANGLDYSPVVPLRPTGGKVFGEVLVPDTNDVEVLRNTLSRLAEMAGMELRSAGLRAARLSLELEYTDARKAARSLKLRQPSAADTELKGVVTNLLEKTLRRRVSIRMVLLRIPELAPAAEQLSLFLPSGEEKHRKIDTAIDTIRARFGTEAIGYVRTVE